MVQVGQYWDKVKGPAAHLGSAALGVLTGSVAGVMATSSIATSNMANRWLETSTYNLTSIANDGVSALAAENFLTFTGEMSGLFGSMAVLLASRTLGKNVAGDAFKQATSMTAGIVTAAVIFGAAGTINNFKAHQHQGWCVDTYTSGADLYDCHSKTPQPITLGLG